MGWEITTWVMRIFNIALLIFIGPILYFLIKSELQSYKKEMQAEKNNKCMFCQRVSILAWACHNDTDHCINCCYCPDHIDTIHRNNTCATAKPNTWCGQCAEIN